MRTIGNFISRERVLEICERLGADDVRKEVMTLFSFPAPNPGGEGETNLMGQTQEEFWDNVEKEK